MITIKMTKAVYRRQVRRIMRAVYTHCKYTEDPATAYKRDVNATIYHQLQRPEDASIKVEIERIAESHGVCFDFVASYQIKNGRREYVSGRTPSEVTKRLYKALVAAMPTPKI